MSDPERAFIARRLRYAEWQVAEAEAEAQRQRDRLRDLRRLLPPGAPQAAHTPPAPAHTPCLHTGARISYRPNHGMDVCAECGLTVLARGQG